MPAIGKAAGDDKHEPIVASEDAPYDSLGGSVYAETRRVAQDAAGLGLHQVTDPLDEMLAQANKRAIKWAEERSAEFVTQIRETTRDRVREMVVKALDEGWSNDQLANALEDSEAFSDARALMIARTETAFADVAGNLIGWKESGVVESKEWIVAQDNECDACAELQGEIVPLDEEFPEGDPPLHPNCRCDVLPVLADPEE